MDKGTWTHAHPALSPVHVWHGACVCCVRYTRAHVHYPRGQTRNRSSVTVGTEPQTSVLGGKQTPTDVTVFFLALMCFLLLAVLPFSSPFSFSIFLSSSFYLSLTSHPPSSPVNTLTRSC